MNKKLLLILSILMSLSLFTMSCAKSVTAPDNPTGIAGLDDLTEKQLETALKAVEPITTTGGVTFDFSTGIFANPNNSYNFSINSTGAYQNVSQAEVLNLLLQKLSAYKGEVSFNVPTGAWNGDPTGSNSATLTVSVSSSNYNIPDTLQSITITLYLMGTWE
ncbi:hypothetical protein R4K48_13795 [Brachyspira pulli]|uniref:hypothetical protein n=1 Tax=Brachyspira pulli TaxID=310721 RepID=UPI003003D641